MRTEMQETLVGAAIAVAAGGFGWLFHLGNRVAVLEILRVEDAKRLERIEDKIDQLIERLG
jgi:flavin-dependent dehydrogenase